VIGGRDRLGEAVGACRYLRHMVVCGLILLSQLFEEVVLQDLRSRVTLIWIVYQHLHYNVLSVCTHVGDQFRYAYEFLSLEVEFHVSSMLLKVVKKLLRRCPHDIVNLIYLIKFVIPWKQREQ
jgi:hypothetical protein